MYLPADGHWQFRGVGHTTLKQTRWLRLRRLPKTQKHGRAVTVRSVRVREHPNEEPPGDHDYENDKDNLNSLALLRSDTLLNGEHVEPDVKLRALPFLAIVLLSNGALIGFMAIFLSEVTMGSKISDTVGSSKNADKKVETYQLLNGYISAAAGELLNFAFFVFLAVMVTYLGNLPWHPGQNVVDGRGNVKKAVLWWFTPSSCTSSTWGSRP